MKKKILIGALTAACACACAFGLTACGDEAEGDGHHFAEAWSSNPTYHWHVCEDEDCKEETERIAHSFNGGEVETPATCTAKGSAKYTCTVCGYEESREIAALSHDYVYQTTEFTHTKICSRGDYTASEGESGNHVFTEVDNQNGTATLTCTVCEYEITIPTAASLAQPVLLNEANGEYSVYLHQSAIIDSMTETAYFSFTPEHSMTLTISSEQSLHGHFAIGKRVYSTLNRYYYLSAEEEDEADDAVVKELEGGVTYYISVKSDESGSKRFTFSLTAHNHEYKTDEWEQDDAHHWRAARCHEGSAIVTKIAHTYSGGECSVCNHSVPSATDTLTYTYSGGAPYTATVTGLEASAIATTPSVVIPETAERDGKTYTVTEIAANAFKNNTTIASITIPQSVTKIGAAFAGCSSLNAVYVFDLNAWAVATRTNANSNPLNVNGGDLYENFIKVENAELTVSANIGLYAFAKCNSLKTVTVNVESSALSTGLEVGGYAFANCSNLQSATFGEGVTKLGGNAFENCTKFETVALPESFVGGTGRGYSNFFKNSAIKNIHVNNLEKYAKIEWATSSHPFSVNAATGQNHLFLDNVEIAGALKASDYEITEIGAYAFAGCKGITSVDLTDVTTVGQLAFQYGGLVSIYMTDSITTISASAFGYCTDLNKVDLNRTTDFTAVDNYLFDGCENSAEFVINFAGTQEEYDAMTKFKAAVTNKIPNATVNYEVDFD